MPETASGKPRIAVIGLGSMGFGMATSLRRAGFAVTGCDVSEDAVARFVADGGAGARTPAEAAGQADIVVSVVVNAAQTENHSVRQGRCRRNAGQGPVFVSSATMDPDVARRLAKQLEASGRHYLDAPISAARSARRKASSPSSPRAVRRLRQGAAGARRHGSKALRTRRCRRPGRSVQDDQPVARRRAYRRGFGSHHLRRQQGLDIRKVYEVITASAGNSWMFENRVPHVLDGDYTPRSAVEIFVKDLGIIQTLARTARFPVPVAAAALQCS